MDKLGLMLVNTAQVVTLNPAIIHYEGILMTTQDNHGLGRLQKMSSPRSHSHQVSNRRVIFSSLDSALLSFGALDWLRCMNDKRWFA